MTSEDFKLFFWLSLLENTGGHIYAKRKFGWFHLPFVESQVKVTLINRCGISYEAFEDSRKCNFYLSSFGKLLWKWKYDHAFHWAPTIWNMQCINKYEYSICKLAWVNLYWLDRLLHTFGWILHFGIKAWKLAQW